MIYNQTRAALAAAILMGGATIGSGAAAQIQGGTSGGVTGAGVSASTHGSGQYASGADGSAIGVQGGGAAAAVDGTATSDSKAKLNERRAMQRSVATASDEDERARSRTQTVVNPGGVRSRTTSMYRERGEKPVRETVVTRVQADGTTTTRSK